MRQPIGRQLEREAGEHRGVNAIPQQARQEKHAKPRQDVRSDVRDVVRQHGIVEDPLDRSREDRHTEEMLGERQRVAVGKEERRIPEGGESVGHAVGVPAEHRRDDDRVAEAASDAVRRVPQQGKGREQSRRQEDDERLRRGAHD